MYNPKNLPKIDPPKYYENLRSRTKTVDLGFTKHMEIQTETSQHRSTNANNYSIGESYFMPAVTSAPWSVINKTPKVGRETGFSQYKAA